MGCCSGRMRRGFTGSDGIGGWRGRSVQATEFRFALGFGNVSFAVVGFFQGFVVEGDGVSDVLARAFLSSLVAL